MSHLPSIPSNNDATIRAYLLKSGNVRAGTPNLYWADDHRLNLRRWAHKRNVAHRQMMQERGNTAPLPYMAHAAETFEKPSKHSEGGKRAARLAKRAARERMEA